MKLGLSRRRYVARFPAMLFIALAAVCVQGAASARVLKVGVHQPLDRPSAAAAIARDGDTIAIEPGEYHDCSVWLPSQLTISGTADGVVITGELCERKALFVTKGDNITIRNITFTSAYGPYGNGAGIRAEGRELTVENCHFIDNEDAILAANRPDADGVLTIIGSTFTGNGHCRTGCTAHGVYAGHSALLRIIGSKFFATMIGHHVKSRALMTELTDDDIEDGPDGTSSFLVDVPNGGALVMRSSVLEKGARSSNSTAAVMIGEEGAIKPTPELRIVGNRFTNDQPQQTIFVRNLTATPAILTGNMLKGPVQALSGAGSVR